MSKIKNFKIGHGLDEYKDCPAVKAAVLHHNIECAIEDLVAVFPEQPRFSEQLLRYFIECYNMNFGTTYTLAQSEEIIALQGIKRYSDLLSNSEKG